MEKNTNTSELIHKIYSTSLLISIVAFLIALIWNISIGLPIILNIAIGLFFIGFSLLYYLAVKKRYFSSFIYIILILSFLSLSYFTSAGLNGPIPSTYIIALPVFIGISKPKNHILILIITIANILILILLEKYFLSDFIIENSNMIMREIDLTFGYIINIFLVFIFARFYKKNYDEEKENLIKQKVELQKLNTSKDLLFNIIAHDLKNPFNSLLGYTNLMTDPNNKLTVEEYSKYALRAKKSTAKALNLLEMLLEWGKAQQGRVHFKPEKFKIKSILNELNIYFAENVSNKNIELSYQILDEITVYTDINILRTILRNLISNSFKFTPIGGKINILVEDNNDRVKIVIEDTGIGMDENIVNNLFNFDTKTNRLGTEGESSTGLGLIITNELVSQLGSQLNIESKVNKGSKFEFYVSKI